MDTKKCETCGVDLKISQYARGIAADGTIPKAEDNLVCRNFPACEKAEVEG